MYFDYIYFEILITDNPYKKNLLYNWFYKYSNEGAGNNRNNSINSIQQPHQVVTN